MAANTEATSTCSPTWAAMPWRSPVFTRARMALRLQDRMHGRTPLFIWAVASRHHAPADVGVVYLDGLLSGADVEGAGDGVAAKGLTVGGAAGAAPVVVGEEVGAVAVVEVGLV